jgi:ketosteroid isomerase-like protein
MSRRNHCRLGLAAMSEKVDLVRRSFEAMSAWDVDALLRLYDRDVEFLPLTGTLVESGGYRGHEGVRAYFAEVRELWDVLVPEGHGFRDLGDCVLVTGRCRVRGRVSGAESNPPCAWVIGVRDGRIVSHRTFASYDEALEAAGAEPVEEHAG